ncbi:MAG TPA: serine/threonine-protein kinase [Burkholderiaceae bacterium]
MSTLESAATEFSATAQIAPAINRVARFHILRELGRGSIGSVYLAHDPVIDRDIAIKTFSPKVSSATKKQYEQQFINEARAAGRLSHPNIVTIFDASNENGTTYIAMEYLQGRELSKILKKDLPYTYDDAATIVWKVAEALDYAHKNGVVHRDIKPANIFIVADNQPKLVDFGIARIPNRVAEKTVSLEDAPNTLFHNNLLGTPTYMSPEQATGRQVDLRTDVYSLGAVMYELLAGRKPFQSKNTEKLLQLIAFKSPPAPHEVNPKVPAELSRIVMRAMSKRPEKRYQSANEMALDLKRYLIKGKRERKQLKMPLEMAEQMDEASNDQPSRRRLYWMGCIALIGAITVVGINFWR